jgi:hypothetical protein
MAPSRTSERGEGRIGCILTLLVLALAIAVGLKVVPVYYSNSSLVESAEDVAGQAGLYPVPALTAKLRDKAAELGIPEAAAEGATTVSTAGSKSLGTCTITFDYNRVVDLYGFYSLTIATHKVVTRTYMDAR